MRWFRLVALVVIATVAVLPFGAEAATFEVDNLNDSGAGSLRQAIIDANSNPGDDVIVINVTGTVELTSPLPPISDDVDIEGPGASDFIIDFNGGGNGIQINPVDVRISGVQVTGSNNGGIFIALGGSLELIDSIVRLNTTAFAGAGINNQGTLYVENSVIENNSAPSGPGGGIMNTGRATIRSSRISGNQAGVNNTGGGIFNCGASCTNGSTPIAELKVFGSDISGNTAVAGGGIDNDNGGTLYVGEGTQIYENNAAGSGGGGIQNRGKATIKDSTVTFNTALTGPGGGIFNCGCNGATPELKIFDSTISNNTANGGGGIGNGPGGSLYMEDSLITLNQAVISGGGITNRGEATIIKTEISENETQQLGGGGIGNGNGTMELKYSHVHDNLANNSGGGIINTAALTVFKSTIENNEATTGIGGGIYNCDPNLCSGTSGSAYATILDSVVKGNSAPAGGGIGTNQTSGTVTTTVKSTKILENTFTSDGGGVFNQLATMMVERSLVQGNNGGYGGGGISNSGWLSIERSTIDNNTALLAGGIDNDGSLYMTASTISYNHAVGFAPSAGPAGGLLNSLIAELTNVTISGNTANNEGGGIFNCNNQCSRPEPGMANLTLLNVTIANNSSGVGGGIGNGPGGAASLKHVLLADNFASDGNCWLGSPMTSQGFNLSDDNTCSSFLNQFGDQNNADANIGPLANNGGPTQTHALLPGSDALDAGTNNGCPDEDQRGEDRPEAAISRQPAICDIGAYEFQTPTRDFGGPRNPRRGGGW